MSRLAIKNLWPTGAVRLDIGRRRLLVQQGRSVARWPLPAPLKAGIPGPEALAQLRDGLHGLFASLPDGRGRLDVVVSDALARCWIVERIPGLASRQEITALAERRMQDIYGDGAEQAGQWAVRVDATAFAEQWPAIALPRALLDLLGELAAGKGWSLGCVQTAFVASFNARRVNPFRRPANEIFTLASDDGLTIAIRDRRQWRTLRTHPPLALLANDLPTMLRRECRAAGLHPDDCRVASLAGRRARRSELRLGFAPDRPDASLRLGLGSAMLAGVLALAWSLTGDSEAVLPPHQAVLPSAEEVRAINLAIDELNFPWARVLGLLEATVDDSLRISRFDGDARDGRLSLQGEARDGRAVLDLPGRLRADALVADARVLSQGPAGEVEGGPFPIRFALDFSVQTNEGGQP